MNDQIILSPSNIPVLSKANAKSFHEQVKERIFETGFGLWEYVETIKFFAALDKTINGDSASKIEADKEFICYLRDQLAAYGKDGFTTERGVKVTLAETGTTYDFSVCNDPELADLEAKSKEIADKVKQRKEFLKTLPEEGMSILNEATGEVVTVYRPAKSSKSSFKVSLPK